MYSSLVTSPNVDLILRFSHINYRLFFSHRLHDQRHGRPSRHRSCPCAFFRCNWWRTVRFASVQNLRKYKIYWILSYKISHDEPQHFTSRAVLVRYVPVPNQYHLSSRTLFRTVPSCSPNQFSRHGKSFDSNESNQDSK